MPFHLKISKKGDAQYAQIVETVYDPAVKRGVSRAVESFGNLTKLRLKNPLIDEQIAAKLAELNRNGKLAQQVKFERLARKLPYAASVTADNCGVNVLNYGTAFYRKVWEDLGLDKCFKQIVNNSSGAGKINYVLDTAAFYLVAQRILQPQSKAKTFNSRHEQIYSLGKLTLDDIYQCLKDLGKRKDTIIKNLNANLKECYHRVETVAFYDVTTFYFEAFDSDELRARGLSKENKTNETQVVLGLLVDGEGIPLNYELYRGNTSEMNTLIEVIAKYKQELSDTKLTVIADRGLNSYLNLTKLQELNCDYIVAQSLDRLPDVIKQAVLSEENWDNIFYADAGECDYKLKRLNPNAIIRAYNQGKPKSKQLKERTLEDELIVTWSAQRQAHDIKVLNERYHKSASLLDKSKSTVNASFCHGTRQFIKPSGTNRYQLNTELYEKRLRYSGFYALVTSATTKPSAEVYHDLRKLWHIEECFRVMKTNLNTRPVFVWSEESIKGHFLICYLALVLERFSYYQVKHAGIAISNHQLIEALRALKIAKAVTDKNVWIKLGVSGDHQTNRNHADLTDKIFDIVGLTQLTTLETALSINKKLSLKLTLNL